MRTGYKCGDHVCKAEGYKFPGVVVAKFKKLNGQTRYVVEANNADFEGMLHIFNEKQLTPKLPFK